MISVMNKKVYKGMGVYIGRPSVLGNQFSHLEGTLAKYKVGSREEAVSKYKEWLRAEWVKGGAVKQELLRLVELSKQGDLVLICWCKPLPCHGTVIKEAIEKMAETLD